jgi:hypothetical protein
MSVFANNQSLHEKDTSHPPDADTGTGSDESNIDAIKFFNQHLVVPDVLRVPSPDAFSEISVYLSRRSEEHFVRGPRTLRHNASQRLGPLQKTGAWLSAFWNRNKGPLFVLLSQLFGTLMNVTTRLLELEGNNGKGMHPFQVCLWALPSMKLDTDTN